MTVQLDLFTDAARHPWLYGDLTFSGAPQWASQWSPCDVDGSLRYWQWDHGVDARCSVVYRLTHPVHRRDLPTCHQWACNGRRCMQS